ncbi:tetratricopeptide repeat protein, partial [Akkermansiaceae bacterium]|nr:tetratricopeptide repeat protein [Akkermansiaceae bacterium]
MNTYTLSAVSSISALVLSSVAYASVSDATLSLQNQDYAKAIDLLDAYISGSKKIENENYSLDQLVYLKATAQFYLKQFDQCRQTANSLLENYPDSDWKFKSTFLIAKSHVEQRDYKSAMTIYQSESKRLFDITRKQEIATELIGFADTFSKEPKSTELDAPQPNYLSAYTLYKEVLDIECGTDLRETALLKMIEMQQKVSNHQLVRQHCIEYLTEFDPDWRGLIGSVERTTLQKNLKTLAKGKDNHIAKVRYSLAEALHRQNQRPHAATYLTELIKQIKDKTIVASEGLLADIEWLRIQTLTQQGGRPFDLDSWLVETEKYLATYPSHIHANSTAFFIGNTLKSAGRIEKARESFAKYVENAYGTQVIENPLTAEEETTKQFNTRKTEAEKKRELAMFNIGLIYEQESNFDAAKSAWNDTLKSYPSGAKWAEIQQKVA